MYYIVFTITDTNDIEFLKSIVYKSALNINDIELIITDMTEEIKNDFIVEEVMLIMWKNFLRLNVIFLIIQQLSVCTKDMCNY